MSFYVYINESDIEKWSAVDDLELNQLLQEVRAINPNILIASTVVETKRGWFRKPKRDFLYSLRFSEKYDARIINFPPHRHSCSLNEYVPKSFIMTYLFGYLTGNNYSK